MSQNQSDIFVSFDPVAVSPYTARIKQSQRWPFKIEERGSRPIVKVIPRWQWRVLHDAEIAMRWIANIGILRGWNGKAGDTSLHCNTAVKKTGGRDGTRSEFGFGAGWTLAISLSGRIQIFVRLSGKFCTGRSLDVPKCNFLVQLSSILCHFAQWLEVLPSSQTSVEQNRLTSDLQVFENINAFTVR